MRTAFVNAEIINEGERFTGVLVVEDERIVSVLHQSAYTPSAQERVVDARGLLLLPGVIDAHVHMRDPGLTHKGDMETETCAAAAGGVTTVFDMPNVVPQTTTQELLEEKYRRAATRCHVNYAFYLGATHDNLDDIVQADVTRIPGIKLFMGSSTGNMLVDDEEMLDKIFRLSPTLIMTHCEDTACIADNMKAVVERCGSDDPDVCYHPLVRDEQACLRSTQLAVQLALRHGSRLHVAHLTTSEEVELLRQTASPDITAEVCVAHLLYSDADYARLGTRIKCNPSIKAARHRTALRQALRDGLVRTVATDHAPHLLEEKEGGCRRAMSGMPMIQFSLPSMLQLADEGVLTHDRVVDLMCHNPATLFNVQERGFLRPGYKADFVLLRREPRTITSSDILSRCGWSPREGDTLNWQVEQTWVNGQQVWDGRQIRSDVFGQAVRFGV